MVGGGYACACASSPRSRARACAAWSRRAPTTEVDAREVDQPGGGEELTSPYVDGDELDLRAWARDALALALPGAGRSAAPTAPGLCPQCGENLNDASRTTRHEAAPDPRWAKLRELRLDDRRVVELTVQLVAIDSVNPSLVDGGAGESQISRVRRRAGRATTGSRPRCSRSTPGRPERPRLGGRDRRRPVRSCSAATSTPSTSRAWPSRTRRASRATASTAAAPTT